METISFECLRGIAGVIAEKFGHENSLKTDEWVTRVAYHLGKLLREDFSDAKFEVPKVSHEDKTYFGDMLKVKDDKVYVDDVEVPSHDVGIKYSGKIEIRNNKVGGRPIHIHGDVISNNGIVARTLWLDNLKNSGGIKARKVSGNSIVTDGNIIVEMRYSSDNTTCNKLIVGQDVSADYFICNNGAAVGGDISLSEVHLNGDLSIKGEFKGKIVYRTPKK